MRESDLQIQMVQWLRVRLGPLWLVQHTANKPRSAQSGAMEKRMGAIAGWPDVACYGPRCQTIFFEVKTTKGNLSADQVACHNRLRSLGFEVFVIRTIADLRKVFPTAAADLGRTGEVGHANRPASPNNSPSGPGVPA